MSVNLAERANAVVAQSEQRVFNPKDTEFTTSQRLQFYKKGGNMPHDVNGKLISVGDEVIVRFKVTQVQAHEDYCNVNLESLIPMPPSNTSFTTVSSINTKQVEKV